MTHAYYCACGAKIEMIGVPDEEAEQAIQVFKDNHDRDECEEVEAEEFYTQLVEGEME